MALICSRKTTVAQGAAFNEGVRRNPGGGKPTPRFPHFPERLLERRNFRRPAMFTFCSSMANRSFTDPATAKGAVAAVAGEFTACAGASPKETMHEPLFLHARLTGKLLHKRPELRARQLRHAFFHFVNARKREQSAR